MPDIALVERDRQVRELLGALGRAVTDRAQLLVVTGLAGHGTSALLAHLGDLASRRGSVVVTAGSDDLSRPGPPGTLIMQLVRAGMARLPPDERPGALTGPAATLRSLWAGPAAIDATAIRDGLRAWLADLADLAPVVVVVDDLQRADALSVRLLTALVADATELPVTFVVGMRRGGPVVDEAAVQTLTHRAHRVIDLPPLSRHGIGHLLARHGVRDPDHGVRDHIEALTRGNPLLATELITAAERGDVLPTRLEDDPDGVGRSLSTLVSERLVGDSWDRVRPVVAATALRSGRADVSVLADVLDLSHDEVRDRVVRLVDAEILRRRGGGLEVVHPLVAASAVARDPLRDRPFRAHHA